MKRLFVLLTAASTLVAVPALAQTKPDFSGRWKFNTDKSGRGTQGNTPDMSYPSELVIKQTPTELQFEGLSLRQSETKAVYKFDGSEVTVNSTPGVSEKAKVMWDGPKLVISARKLIPSPTGGTFVTDIKEIWTLNGNVLTIEKTVSAEGESSTRKFLFDKQPS